MTDSPLGDDQEVAGLGARLREQRVSSRLTLETAAARVGLSPAYLSRLETGRRQPSLPVLLGLARAYGTSVSGLLGEQVAEPDPVIRGGVVEPGRAGGWGYRRAGAPGRAMQALRVHVPPGTQDSVVRVHPGEEWLYVTKGRMKLTLGDRVHLLAEGDSAHFDSLTPHVIAADSEAGVDLIFVHTLLQSPAGDLCLGDAPRL
ncbi:MULTISPECIES: helix-turn-helix domain-containing protein [Kitasatospora]|uniref:helix-turn-helix domain-containing protein n=1 Tax=Kitasatospora TaxID=2063 RepID=UPI000C275D94|nr:MULTISPECIES: XRE family transcriptional regulator [Kitasatospora]PJN22349.1 XRE family transcriptional regulator [Kitasatospora sp. CB02891]GGQ89933.1 DNA-binding protein [Kitasatospora griseola]